MSTLNEELDRDYKKQVVIFAERPMNVRAAPSGIIGDIQEVEDLNFANQAQDWTEWNPDYDTKTIPFYGPWELEEALRLLDEDEWLEPGAEAIVMGHSDDAGMFGGVMPGMWEHLLDENFISDKIDNVTLGSCRMGENPLACSALADAFEAPVSGQLKQSWGGGAIPSEHHGSGTLEERTFAPNWGEADYATYTKDREEALDIYSGFRPNEASPEVIDQGFKDYEEDLSKGSSWPGGIPHYWDEFLQGYRPMKVRDYITHMSKDPRFNKNIIGEILNSHPSGYEVQNTLARYYKSVIWGGPEGIPVRTQLQGTRN